MKIKILSVVMVIMILITSLAPVCASAGDAQGSTETSTGESGSDTYATKPQTTQDDAKSKEEAQKELEDVAKKLEENLKNAEKKLAELEKESKVTDEYIDALDQKIGYINEQLTLLENENISLQSQIDLLKPEIEKNEKSLNELSDEVEKSQNELKKLEDKFQSVYEAYCIRLRVMYISGDYNILTALMTCKDISSLLTRYEMIKSVSKSDTELLQEVNEKTKEIVTKKDGLDERLRKYTNIKTKYDEQQATLVASQQKIEQNSEAIAAKKASLAIDRAESDSLLAQLTAQNQQYTEFRNEDESIKAAVEKDIRDLIAGIKSPDEIVIPDLNHSQSSSSGTVSGGKSDVYSNSNAVLNMTYPVPGSYSISAGFPNYSSGKYHGAIDFPCQTGSKVVAAQDGIVIKVKDLGNKSYGKYIMIYHGTDAQGRSVVTLYAHNSQLLVSTGQSVKRGQQIAKSGSTGNSTGPHCHFEIRFDGVQVNPKNYLSK